MKKSLRLIVAIAIIMTMQVNAFALDKTEQGSDDQGSYFGV